MSIQYDDTHFSENMPISDAVKKMHECLEQNIPFQALHVGTEAELNKRKADAVTKADIQSQLDSITNRLNALTDTSSLSNTSPLLLHLPSAEEIKKYAIPSKGEY